MYTYKRVAAEPGAKNLACVDAFHLKARTRMEHCCRRSFDSGLRSGVCSGSEAGLYLRRIDVSITQL